MAEQTYALAQSGVYGLSNGVYTDALSSPTYADGFEDGDVAEWTVHNGTLSAVTTDPVDGSYHAELGGNSAWSLVAERTDWTYSSSDVPEIHLYVAGSVSGGSNASAAGSAFGIQDTTNFYLSGVNAASTEHYIKDSTGSNIIVIQDSGLSKGTYRKHIVTHDPSTGDITFEVQKLDGTVINSKSATDTQFGAGTVGLSAYRNTNYMDTVEVYL